MACCNAGRRLIEDIQSGRHKPEVISVEQWESEQD
jgi:hypothetical protein